MRSTEIIKNCSSSLCTCLHHMVILRTRNKITDFLMILAWASPFKYKQKSDIAYFVPFLQNLQVLELHMVKVRGPICIWRSAQQTCLQSAVYKHVLPFRTEFSQPLIH